MILERLGKFPLKDNTQLRNHGDNELDDDFNFSTSEDSGGPMEDSGKFSFSSGII